jgi:hypothetical protein
MTSWLEARRRTGAQLRQDGGDGEGPSGAAAGAAEDRDKMDSGSVAPVKKKGATRALARWGKEVARRRKISSVVSSVGNEWSREESAAGL